MCDTLSISPIQELVMQSAGCSFIWGAICIPQHPVPDEGEVDISSNKEEDVLNFLEKNSGGAKLRRRCENEVPVCSRRDVD